MSGNDDVIKELKKIELITTVTGGSILGGVLGVVVSALNERRNGCNEKNPGTIIENIALNGGLGAGLGALLGYISQNDVNCPTSNN